MKLLKKLLDTASLITFFTSFSDKTPWTQTTDFVEFGDADSSVRAGVHVARRPVVFLYVPQLFRMRHQGINDFSVNHNLCGQ